MIKIIYSCNDLFFDGLYLSILSILRRTKSTFQFFILSGNFQKFNLKYCSVSDKHIKILQELVKSFNKQNELILIDCSIYYEAYLSGNKNERSKYSPYAVLRLLLDKIPYINGKALYLDCDTMANKDISPLWNVDVDGYDFAANKDFLSKYWNLFRKNYFNSGVLLFNLDEIRKSNYLKKCRLILFEKKLFLPDQTAMYKCASNFKFFPGNYIYNDQSGKVKKDTIVKHFCARIIGWPFLHNIKQWQIKKVHKYLKIHNFDQDYKIYLKNKKKWQ